MSTHKADYIIVGSGLTGAAIARLLFDVGRDVLVIERRGHIGGNVSDHIHESGIRIHTYGPHYFRTGSERIWEFINRFSSFYPYVACLQTEVDGSLYPWPIDTATLRSFAGENWTSDFQGHAPTNFEEASLAMMPHVIYQKFVYGYTLKQWGVQPKQLSATLARRFDVRHDGDLRLFRHPYQGLPSTGYARLMSRMLEGIPIVMNTDFLLRQDEFVARKLLVYTGPVDAFFDYKYGRLKYRGQIRKTEYHAGLDRVQPVGQVNNPTLAGGEHVRTLEWKHMMPEIYASKIRGTVITRETPYTPEDPDAYEYPFPDEQNTQLYQKYAKDAEKLRNVLICGRLGEYRYYDMDQAIGRAIMLGESILKGAS